MEFNTLEKLRAFISQIDKLLLSDFSHSATEPALLGLKSFFEDQRTRVRRASKLDKRVLLGVCKTVNERIHEYLPVLGFLLRSTNVRNSFEVYHLLEEYARSLVGTEAQFILSSEWDFSPLTYAMTFRVLPDYVFVGLPSSESTNALVIPLAGHELGHSVWVKENFESQFNARIEPRVKREIAEQWSRITNVFPEHTNQPKPRSNDDYGSIFLSQTVAEISSLALSQCEETFCDALGVAIFGASFAYAFHYLLAPNLGSERAPQYPSLKKRAEYISALGHADLTPYFPDYPGEFEGVGMNGASREDVILAIADAVSDTLAPALYDLAADLAKSKLSDRLPSEQKRTKILQMFNLDVPAETDGSLADIINAGWIYVLSRRATHPEHERSITEWVTELILKTAEVLEFNRRVK